MASPGGSRHPEPAGQESAETKSVAQRLCVLGRVQGVGFRPFVVRLAAGLRLGGWVKNTPDGVVIHIEGPEVPLADFRRRLTGELPPAAEVLSVTVEDTLPEGHRGFAIRRSDEIGSAGKPGAGALLRVLITPDLAACPACLAEFHSAEDRRHGFALSGCTDCGPRFSIQVSAPFDRERTTMIDFLLCPDCQKEYEDPADRRFHAQNTSCPRCGPRIWLEPGGAPHSLPQPAPEPADTSDFPVLEQAARQLREGKILAVKGIGGFHLLCDATSEQAVTLLRERKRRDRKPLAVLFGNLEEIGAHAEVDEAARAALLSAEAPIVLLSAGPIRPWRPAWHPGWPASASSLPTRHCTGPWCRWSAGRWWRRAETRATNRCRPRTPRRVPSSDISRMRSSSTTAGFSAMPMTAWCGSSPGGRCRSGSAVGWPRCASSYRSSPPHCLPPGAT